MSRYKLFDRGPLVMRTLCERGHDLHAADVAPLKPVSEMQRCADMSALVKAIVRARAANRPRILMMGGHPIKLGLSRFLIDLVEAGWITHVATNGAGIVHDFEMALAGGTSENVAKWIRLGQFGLWKETGILNEVIRQAAELGEGLGEGVGRYIVDQKLPYSEISVAAAGWRCGVPVTGHVTIGGDIIHAHANCDGAALGTAAYTDFLIFAKSVADLEGGVFLNVGSAVTGPEVYLKALSMARNVARTRGQEIRQITTAVFDLVPLPANWRQGVPSRDEARYYFRPWKTVLVRTVGDGGQSYYLHGDHRQTVPTLWTALSSVVSYDGASEMAAP